MRRLWSILYKIFAAKYDNNNWMDNRKMYWKTTSKQASKQRYSPT